MGTRHELSALGVRPGGGGADALTLSELRRLRREHRDGRLRVYRDHLARRVRLALSLLLDTCRPVDIDAAVWRLGPDAVWPGGRGSQHAPVGNHGGHPSRHGHRGCSVLRKQGRSAHLLIRVGGAFIQTNDGGGRLVVSAPGLRIDAHRLRSGRLGEVFPHPAIVGQPYAIEFIVRDTTGFLYLIDFAALPIEWGVPCPDTNSPRATAAGFPPRPFSSF